MFIKQVLKIFLLVACVSCSPALKQILEPHQIDISEVPWQVTVQRFGYPLCGGAIISKDWILTSAKCVDNTLSPSYLSVRVGSSSDRAGGQVLDLKQLIKHENFKTYVFDYDYALIQLNESIKFDATKQPIKLHNFDEEISVGTIVQESGWAKYKSDLDVTLQKVELPIVSRRDCKLVNSELGPRMIGAGIKKGEKTACGGATGCPVTLLKNKIPVLVGVYTSTCDEYTLNTDPLVVIARVSAGRKWITEKTGI